MKLFHRNQIIAFVVLGIFFVAIDLMFWDLTSGLQSDAENYMLAQVVRGTAVLAPFVVLFGVILRTILRKRKENKHQ